MLEAVPKLAKPTGLIDSRNNDTLFNLILVGATVPKPQPHAFYMCICLPWIIFRTLKSRAIHIL